jgi:hypothetical protein
MEHRVLVVHQVLMGRVVHQGLQGLQVQVVHQVLQEQVVHQGQVVHQELQVLVG